MAVCAACTAFVACASASASNAPRVRQPAPNTQANSTSAAASLIASWFICACFLACHFTGHTVRSSNASQPCVCVPHFSNETRVVIVPAKPKRHRQVSSCAGKFGVAYTACPVVNNNVQQLHTVSFTRKKPAHFAICLVRLQTS